MKSSLLRSLKKWTACFNSVYSFKPSTFLKQTLLFVLLACSSHVIATGQGDTQRLLSVSMMTESGHIASDMTQDLALIMTPKEGWHGYWTNPGDAGFPTRFDWHLPKGIEAGEVKYPAPSQLLTSDIMNYIYHDQYILLAPITVSKAIAVGTSVPIKVDMSYLVCNPTSCLPEQQTVEHTFTVGEDSQLLLDKKSSNDSNKELFDQWRQKLPQPMAAVGRFSVDKSKLTLALPLPSSVDIEGAHIYPVINGMIVNNAKQALQHKGDELLMQTQVGDNLEPVFKGVLVLKNGIGLSFSANKTEAIAFTPTVDNAKDTNGPNSWWLAITALLGAILGGLLLNIMPCVFPILSLKILSLSHQSSEERAKIGAIAYTLGAVLVCLVLGAAILSLRALGHQIGWAFQLQSPVMISVLIVLMSAIGFNLAGLFEIGTLTSGSKLQDQKGPMGDFWTGGLAALIATPCTGPFMATALGAALVLPMSIALMIFAGLGFGMALPFLLVSFIPKLRTCLPKPGGWMITARKILSIPMFITTLGLVWILLRQSTDTYVMMILTTTMLSTFGLWLTGAWQKSQHKRKWWPALLFTFIPLLLSIYTIPNSDELNVSSVQKEGTQVLSFDQNKLAELRAKQDMFVYFTADWCLTCKVNEKTSIDRDEVQHAFKQNNVAVMVGDWTNGDSQITEFLSQQGRSGVPLYLWYKKGEDTPVVLPQVLTPSILVDHAKQY